MKEKLFSAQHSNMYWKNNSPQRIASIISGLAFGQAANVQKIPLQNNETVHQWGMCSPPTGTRQTYVHPEQRLYPLQRGLLQVTLMTLSELYFSNPTRLFYHLSFQLQLLQGFHKISEDTANFSRQLFSDLYSNNTAGLRKVSWKHGHGEEYHCLCMRPSWSREHYLKPKEEIHACPQKLIILNPNQTLNCLKRCLQL